MPNISKMEREAAAAKALLKGQEDVRADIKRKEKLVSDDETVLDMFQHPGWTLLKEQFVRSLGKKEERFYDPELPLTPDEIQNLRFEMIYLRRVLHLDTETKNRLNSIRKDIKALSAKLADGQG